MRKAGLLVSAGLLLWHGAAFALGLGNVQLHSHLGEKLEAEMPVVGMGQWIADDLKVTIASQDTYRKLDIDYLPSHQRLAFAIRPNEKNEPTLYISSRDSIKEPYLHFVLEIDYPQGKMMKDVSLLLDAPDELPPIADK